MVCNFLMLALLAAGAAGSAACPLDCACSGTSIDCSATDRREPPAGVWPDATSLHLDKNGIAHLFNHSFSGFWKLSYVNLGSNQLRELDLSVFAWFPKRFSLMADRNLISSIAPPPEGLKAATLDILSLIGNQLTTLHPDAFASAPSLRHLYLDGNPLAVSGDGPVINHPKVLYFTLSRIDASAISPRTFSGLPNLQIFIAEESGVRNITGAFLNNPLLNYVSVGRNNITELLPGTFVLSKKFDSVLLHNNPLSVVEVSALDGAVKAGAMLFVQNSPMVCECNYEHLYRWAQDAGIKLSASCTGKPSCSFT